ncbi:hypothetical protein [Pseudoxanthomonas sp. 10H]|uniref:hypothetical protein n=1 Tax=Pseudoxanthomonas sp. 10H TaxID=3242729 RepID=UPI003556837E
MNVVDFFHGSAYQAEDLLHGIGFLLNVPVAYFAPGVHTFASRSERRGRLVWLNGMAFAGFALLVAGFAVRWGWL